MPGSTGWILDHLEWNWSFILMSRLKSVKAKLSFGPNLEDYLTVYTASLVYNVAKREHCQIGL